MTPSYPTKPGSQLILFLANIPLLCMALVAATVGQTLFVQYFQRNACYEYAEAQGLNPADLTFTGVVIASNQFKGHVCNFKDKDGIPKSVSYNPEDVPAGRDTAQVMAMVCPFLLIGIIGSIFWERLRSYLINREKI